MTHDEIIELLILSRGIIREVGGRRGTARIDAVIDYLNEREEYLSKYRWHDLRKDPDDLPADGETVLMEGRLGTKTLYGVFVFHADEKWFDDGINSRELIDRFMYAWTEIDPFEAVEE